MTSKYQKIVDHFITAIETGERKTGEKLPSVRTLSQQFHCSKDTAQKALTELKYQKYIYAIPKSGYYVLENNQDKKQDLELSLTDDHYQAYEDFRICINETLIGRENYLFNYYPQQEGLEELRLSVQKLLFNQAVYSQLEQIVLTSGTQQALYILSQIDFPNQKRQILVEQPTYHRMNQLLLSQHLPYRTIERDSQGVNLAELEHIFQTGHIKFFYTIPRFHYPLGHSYNREEKEEILRLAQVYDVYIVEDDYLGDFDSKQELTFHYLDHHQRVIYIKSFSTSLFSALRITALLLPMTIKENFIRYKSIMDYDSNLIMQKALSLYIDNHMFEKNRLALLSLQASKEEKAKKLLDRLSLSTPYSLCIDGIVFDLHSLPSVSALKHSQLPFDFFENTYIQSCPYQYAKMRYDDLAKNTKSLTDYLGKEEKI